MIEYVYPTNIDDRILLKTKNILESGGLIGYPTDTSFGIGCSSKSKIGIEKLRRLKGSFNNFALTFICSEISQIAEVTELNNTNFRFIKKYVPGPYVFILKALPHIEKKINIKRMEIGVRIPNNPITLAIIKSLEVPLYSITASKIIEDNTLWDKNYALENLYEYSYEFDDIRDIDIVIDDGNPQPKILSTVINLTGSEPEIVRIGAGVL